MKSDLRTSSQQHQVQSLRHMVEKNEAVQLASDIGQYAVCMVVTCHDLTQCFITGAVGYYECSSLEGTGLDDIVQAAAVNGLASKPRRRRPFKKYDIKFDCIIMHYKHAYSIPLRPGLPPNTEVPEICVPPSTLQSEWLKMVNNEHLSDVQFYYKTDCYHGHKVVLCAASELFQQIFEIGRELKREESLSQCINTWSKKRLNAINKQYINNGAVGAFRNIYDK